MGLKSLINPPFNGIKRDPDGELSLFKSCIEPLHPHLRNTPRVQNPQLRRLDVAKERNDLLLGLHKKSQLVKAEVRVAVTGRKHRDANLAVPHRGIDLLKQLVPGFHVLAVQERPEVQPGEVVVEQRGHRPLRVDAPVVDEDVARRRSDRPAPLVENLALYQAHGS